MDSYSSFSHYLLLSAMSGRLMGDSGAATVIANAIVKKLGSSKAILAIILVCALLTYGGVSGFVVVFAIYPAAKNLFKIADIPKRLIPAAISVGSFTFTLTALPGTPAIQNAIPIPYYNTNLFAAPILGVIGGIIMFELGRWWVQSRANKAKSAGEGYGQHKDGFEGGINVAKSDISQNNTTQGEEFVTGHTVNEKAPISFTMVIIPLILVIGINALLVYAIFPTIDFSALQTQFPDLNIAGSLRLWSIIISLVIACLDLTIMRS